MAGRMRGRIPSSLARGRDRFDSWRRGQTPRTRIPDRLWTLAVRLAREHGLSPTASALKVDYYALKKRLESQDSPSAALSGAFVEVSPPPPPGSAECVIEFEDGAGARLRVLLRSCDVPDVVALGRSFWGGE